MSENAKTPLETISKDDFSSMTDTELLDHGVEVMSYRDSLQTPNSRKNRERYRVCDFRVETIRDVLKARLSRRKNVFPDDSENPELMDVSNDRLEELIFPVTRNATA